MLKRATATSTSLLVLATFAGGADGDEARPPHRPLAHDVAVEYVAAIYGELGVMAKAASALGRSEDLPRFPFLRQGAASLDLRFEPDGERVRVFGIGGESREHTLDRSELEGLVEARLDLPFNGWGLPDAIGRDRGTLIEASELLRREFDTWVRNLPKSQRGVARAFRSAHRTARLYVEAIYAELGGPGPSPRPELALLREKAGPGKLTLTFEADGEHVRVVGIGGGPHRLTRSQLQQLVEARLGAHLHRGGLPEVAWRIPDLKGGANGSLRSARQRLARIAWRSNTATVKESPAGPARLPTHEQRAPDGNTRRRDVRRAAELSRGAARRSRPAKPVSARSAHK